MPALDTLGSVYYQPDLNGPRKKKQPLYDGSFTLPASAAPAARQTPGFAPPAPLPGVAPGGQVTVAPVTAAPKQDYSYDPILNAMTLLSNADEGTATAAALKAKRDVALGLGSKTFAQSILGLDDPTLSKIGADPEHSVSALADLGRSYAKTTDTADRQLFNANLGFGGFRAKTLAEIGQNRTIDEARALQQAQAGIGTIDSTLAQALRDIKARKAQAEAEAAQRAAEAAARNPPANPAIVGAANPSGYPIQVTPGVNDKVPTGSLPDFTNPLLSGFESATDLQGGPGNHGPAGDADPTGLFPWSTELPTAIDSPYATGGLSANSTQGVYAHDLGHVDPLDALAAALAAPKKRKTGYDYAGQLH